MFKKKKNDPQTSQNQTITQQTTETKQNHDKNTLRWHYVLDHLSTQEGDVVLREHVRLYQTVAQQKKYLWLVLSILVLLLIILSMVLWAFLYQFPKNRYIFTHNNQEICRLSSPIAYPMSASVLTQFAQTAISELYRFDYINIKPHLQSTLNRFFTLNGRYRYYETLESSGNLSKVENNKLISRVLIEKAPQIEKESQQGNQKIWEVAVPIKMEFYVGSAQAQSKPESESSYLAWLTIIQESPSIDNPRGLAIDALVLKPI